ncbi:MAG TPA: GIY-YIG nuclease family protein [Candidatus Saccharibacteria bacterium]|nr:putative endonuclease [Patescibacteria group bacterium]HMS31314.1 GIY-YIG nuclease family protein [Candidatus Saccharibacteria bacterium]
MFHVYILRLSNSKHYIGRTNNIESRLIRHQTGQVRSTKAFRPVELIYQEVFESRSEGVKRELYLKSLKSHEAVEKIIHSGDGPVV